MSSGLRYRADIDGLRALAILPVVLYHAGVSAIGGGFVGVDIFFVISGFLITSLILADLERGTYSTYDFWKRRARRILPALCVVLLATLAAGWFLLLPDDFAWLGKQVAAQSTFVSNVLFFHNTDYFAGEAYLSPLLHTWSLSVEEQFYLLFPLGLFLVWHLWRRYLTRCLLVLVVIFYGLCILGTAWDKDMAFFLFRGWELLVGALTVMLLPAASNAGAKLRSIIGLAGLVFMLIAIFGFDDAMAFPGWYAALPCLGAAMVIWANASGVTLSGKILSARPLVWTGLVSYSLYLWHWPVLSFLRYETGGPLSTAQAVVGVTVSLILAILTWKFVEQPFRQGAFSKVSRKTVLQASCAMLCAFAFTGLLVSFAGGFAARFDPAVLQYAAGVADNNPRMAECNGKTAADIRNGKLCRFNEASGATPAFLLWGDSHADSLVPMMEELSAKHGVDGYIATYNGCPPLYGHKQDGKGRNHCDAFNDALPEFIRDQKIKHVFLITSWRSWLERREILFDDLSWYAPYREKFPDPRMAAMMKTIDLLQADGVTVYTMPDLPEADFDPPRRLALEKMRGGDDTNIAIGRKEYDASIVRSSADFFKRANNKELVVIDQTSKLCDDISCKVQAGGYSLYSNYTHLSVRGTKYIEDVFDPYFEAMD